MSICFASSLWPLAEYWNEADTIENKSSAVLKLGLLDECLLVDQEILRKTGAA